MPWRSRTEQLPDTSVDEREKSDSISAPIETSADEAHSNGNASSAHDEVAAPELSPASESVSLKIALLRHPLIFLVIVVILIGVAGGTAFARKPTYTGEVRLLVGQVDVQSRSIPGFTQATQDLASLYARVVPTDVVMKPAARDAHVTEAVAQNSISASPIPAASIIRVEATSTNEARAVSLAGAAAMALSRYVKTINHNDPYSTPVFVQYQAAADTLAGAQVAQQAIQAKVGALESPSSPQSFLSGPDHDAQLSALQQQLVAATSATLQAQLKANALAAQIQNAGGNDSIDATLRVIAPATSQGNDRKNSVEIALLIGLVGGVLLGLGVVMVRANAHYLSMLRRRAVAAPVN